MSPQESRPAATNCETAKDVSAGSVKSVPIVSQARPSVTRFDSRRVLARRWIIRELDELLGLFRYPDPAVVYAMEPSREDPAVFDAIVAQLSDCGEPE